MLTLLPSFFIINRFLEDTCVIVTVAFLLSRGSLLTRIFSGRRGLGDQLILAVVFAVIGASEFLFPGDRYPYVPYTLATAFAGFAGGLSLGLMAAAVLVTVDALCALTGLTHFGLPAYALSLPAAAVIGAACAGAFQWRRRVSEGSHWRLAVLVSGSFAAGALAEVCHAAIELAMPGALAAYAPVPRPLSPGIIAGCVAANGFGCLLLALVLQDAHETQLAQQLLVRTERELSALRVSQLDELQARLHPHFLFNALAAIAGLCVIDPRHAERAVTDLASLLRTFLRSSPEAIIPLSEELDTVGAYLSIEKLRMGERIEVRQDVPRELLAMPVPRFSLQIPVENAVQHGIAESGDLGRIWIVARRRSGFLLLAVCDNGAGVRRSSANRERLGAKTTVHGLGLLAARLRLAYGSGARIRLMSSTSRGTICALRIPVSDRQAAK